MKNKIRKYVGNFFTGAALLSLGTMIYPSGGFGPGIYSSFLIDYPEVGVYLQLQEDLGAERSRDKIHGGLKLEGRILEDDLKKIEKFKQSITTKNYYIRERILEKKVEDFREIYPNIEELTQKSEDILSSGRKYMGYGFAGFILSMAGMIASSYKEGE